MFEIFEKKCHLCSIVSEISPFEALFTVFKILYLFLKDKAKKSNEELTVNFNYRCPLRQKHLDKTTRNT